MRPAGTAVASPLGACGAARTFVRNGRRLGRNTARTPGTNLWNVNLLKRVSISETKKFEFRAEFYNVFNHPNYLQGSISPFSPAGAASYAIRSSSPSDPARG